MANALSAARLALVFPFVFLIVRGDALGAFLAAVLFVIAIVTDLLDGRIARSRGTESALGRALDHTADFLFVSGGLAAGAWQGLVPWALPPLVAVAFVQYVADSLLAHRERELRMSSLGRWNGVLYFVPLGGVLLVQMGMDVLETLNRFVAWALVLSTLASITDRLLALRPRRRTARDSHDARK